MIDNKLAKLHRLVFYTLLFCIPVNLGKHFIYKWSYVNGILVDYLIPTLYLTDILMVILLIVWLIDLQRHKKTLSHLFGIKSFQLLAVYIVSVFLSALSAERVNPALFAFGRLLLVCGLAIYTYETFNIKRDFKKVVLVIALAIMFESILSGFQWIKQSSVFNNYLFFGEQPYHSYTPYIVKENYFGVAKIPPYGTFKHPNVLGAFLSVVLIWLISFKIQHKKLSRLTLLFGISVLLLTVSKFSWLAFVFGLFIYYLSIKQYKYTLILGAFITSLIICLSFLLPLIPKSAYFVYDPSYFIRSELLSVSYKQIPTTLLFGCGFNNSPLCLVSYLKSSIYLNFIQPVHNIYVLVLLESGVFSFILFILFLISVGLNALKNKGSISIFQISFMQVLILGSFDHYFFTSHSAQLIFWLTISFLLKYNLTNEEK